MFFFYDSYMFTIIIMFINVRIFENTFVCIYRKDNFVNQNEELLKFLLAYFVQVLFRHCLYLAEFSFFPNAMITY